MDYNLIMNFLVDYLPQLFLNLFIVIYILKLLTNTIEYFKCYKDLKMLNRNGRILLFILSITVSPIIQLFFYIKEKYDGV